MGHDYLHDIDKPAYSIHHTDGESVILL